MRNLNIFFLVFVEFSILLKKAISILGPGLYFLLFLEVPLLLFSLAWGWLLLVELGKGLIPRHSWSDHCPGSSKRLLTKEFCKTTSSKPFNHIRGGQRTAVGLGPLFLSRGSCGMNAGHLTWWQMPLSSDLLTSPDSLFHFCFFPSGLGLP